MNNIEKVKYIVELKALTASLEHGSLSLFETAQTKKRLQDICALFDEPIFQQYLPKGFVKNEVKIVASHLAQLGVTNPKISTQKADPLPQTTQKNTQNVIVEESQTTHNPTLKNDLAENKVNHSVNLNVEEPVLLEAPIQQTTPKLQHVRLNDIDFPVTPIRINDAESSLYCLPTQENSRSIILINALNIGNLIDRPIFMAEETTSIGNFTQYIIYMGAEDEIEAIHSLKLYSQNLSREFSAIRQLKWQDLKDALNSDESLFKTYTSSNIIVWQKDSYFPFIPQSLVSNRKFILFEEDEAHAETPLLFLEERGKIRLICGKNRLMLNEQELAYPYVTFTRQQGLNWQKIQEIIASLTQPIATLDLLNALNSHIKNA